jgi:hypothetical protein
MSTGLNISADADLNGQYQTLAIATTDEDVKPCDIDRIGTQARSVAFDMLKWSSDASRSRKEIKARTEALRPLLLQVKAAFDAGLLVNGLPTWTQWVQSTGYTIRRFQQIIYPKPRPMRNVSPAHSFTGFDEVIGRIKLNSEESTALKDLDLNELSSEERNSFDVNTTMVSFNLMNPCWHKAAETIVKKCEEVADEHCEDDVLRRLGNKIRKIVGMEETVSLEFGKTYLVRDGSRNELEEMIYDGQDSDWYAFIPTGRTTGHAVLEKNAAKVWELYEQGELKAVKIPNKLVLVRKVTQ